MSSVPHWSGKNLNMVWFLDNDKVTLDKMSVDINAVGTKVADGILGAKRTKNQFILDHYELKLAVQQSKLEAIEALLKIQDNRDADALELISTVGLVFVFNDSTKDIATLQDITVDDWSWAISGRTDRNKVTIPMRANIFKKLAA